MIINNNSSINSIAVNKFMHTLMWIISCDVVMEGNLHADQYCEGSLDHSKTIMISGSHRNPQGIHKSDEKFNTKPSKSSAIPVQITSGSSRLGVLAILLIPMFVITPMAFAADTNVLVIGSSKSFSADYYATISGHQQAFNAILVANELDLILDGNNVLGTINVAFEDVYSSVTRNMKSTTAQCRTYSLQDYYYHPDNRANRGENLKGNDGTVWDFVILMEDPSIIVNTPGVNANGVRLIVNKIKEGSPQAQSILLMQWPHSGYSVSVSDFGEVTYRVGTLVEFPRNCGGLMSAKMPRGAFK